MLHIIWCVIFLGVCTITDLKERHIYLGYCLINMTVALLINIFFKNVEWINIVAGVGLGVIFFVLSMITKEALGKGDAVIILVLGSICGIEMSFKIVTWAFILCSIASIVKMIIKRKSVKDEIPFAPFLLCGCVLTILIRGDGG